MAQIDLDRLYEQFNSEASEQDGNFYFVRSYDEELYRRLCKIERNAVVNLDHSGSELRNALEYFLRTAYLDAQERNPGQQGSAAPEGKNKMPVNPYDFLLYLKRIRIWEWTSMWPMWCAEPRMSTTMLTSKIRSLRFRRRMRICAAPFGACRESLLSITVRDTRIRSAI